MTQHSREYPHVAEQKFIKETYAPSVENTVTQ
jgi:hypothetical protein